MKKELKERVNRLDLSQDSRLLHLLIGWFAISEEFDRAVELLIEKAEK